MPSYQADNGVPMTQPPREARHLRSLLAWLETNYTSARAGTRDLRAQAVAEMESAIQLYEQGLGPLPTGDTLFCPLKMPRRSPGRASVAVGPKIKAAQVYKQLQQVRKLLLPGIQLVVTPSWLSEDGGEFIDQAWDAAEEQVAKHARMSVDGLRPAEANFKCIVPFLFTTAFKVRSFAAGHELTLQHSVTKPKDRQAVKQAFAEVFGKRFKWNGTMRSTMVIKV